MKKYLKWFILAFLIFVFALITRELLHNELTSFDTFIHDFIISFKCPFLTSFFKFFSFLSSAAFLTVLSILLFFVFKNKKFPLLSLFNLILIVLINQIMKFIFSRPRPFEWMLTEESGFSFPSGHAMVSSAFYGLIIYLVWRTNIDKKYKIVLTIILSLLVFTIGLSRIYLGVHYASDVIAGFTISVSYLIITTSLISYYFKKY